MELVLLLTIQAAADIQSRILLLLILVSLLPVTCIFLKESTGMSASSICVTWVAVAVGTCLYTAKRLDGMQQSVFQMALTTEAQYYQVLQPEADTNQHLVQLSTILSKCSDGSFQQVLQTEQDLRRNYELAKSHMSIFQTVVCKPLASTGLEVVAKIKSLTELDEREGGADILFCEVWCDSLQEVQDAWDMLKDLDGVEIVSARDFFAVASYKKNCKVVVSLQGYLTTVVLMEKSLSSWEAQKGLSDAADSLGLLDKTKASAWEVSRLQRDSEVPRCVFVATAFLRLVALFSCYIIGGQLGGQLGDGDDWDPVFGLKGLRHCPSHYVCDEDDVTCPYRTSRTVSHGECGLKLNPRMLAMTLPFLTCFLILLWEMLSCCCCLCCRKHRRSFKIRPRPTQLWYRTYLGVQGCYYAFKVAALQFLTVVMQGLAKASLFRTIQDTHGSESLRASTAVHCFMVLLLCNILFPAMILVIPNYVFSRVGAALLDAVLDVGYMVTSIWLYVRFAAIYALTDIFLSSFLNYMSIYICVAHVLCVCRSLETADWIALFQVPHAAPACKAWKTMILSSAYALALLAFVGIPVGGIVLGAFSDSSHAGLCPHCQCSTVAPTSLLLERCVIPTSYVAKGAVSRLEFNLTNRNITEVLPDAFIARGAHQKVRSISLRGNHLTELPEGLFRDLLQQTRIDTVDLADNRIVTLSRGVIQADFTGYVGILDMSQNQLQELYAETFHGLRLQSGGILNMSRNKLQVLHADTFYGLVGSYSCTLDMSCNKLQVLPPKVFDRLELNRLYLQDNDLSQLHAGTFQGLIFCPCCSYCILDISHNKLQELPPKVFDGLKPNQLSLQSNVLSRLHAETFHGLTIGHEGILDMSQNKLQVLHADAFQNLTFGERGILDMSQNKLQVLHADAFHGLTFGDKGILDMSQNKLQVLHADAFHGLTFGDKGVLDMSQNKLQVLHADAFHGLTFGDKGILDMSQNKLQALHANAFHGLTFRWYGILDMSQNKLQALHANAFHGLTFRWYGILDMSQNKLQALHANAFHGLTFGYRGILNISHNQLQELHADAFQNLTFGENSILDISHNKLQELPPEVFGGLELQQLSLQDNDLSQLHPETFYGLSFAGWYVILDISHNKLQELPPKVFDSLQLDWLNLQNNNLIQLHAETFQGLTFSWNGILDISHNKLQDLPPKVFNGTAGLEILDLADNELVTLSSDAFHGLSDLRSLRLEGNQLRSLGGRPFYWLIRLEELNLEQNQLTDLDEDVFDSYSKSYYYGYQYHSLKRNLLELNLDGNRLTALPDGLFNGFRKLRTLQLQSNQLVRLPPKLFQTLGEIRWAFTEL